MDPKVKRSLKLKRDYYAKNKKIYNKTLSGADVNGLEKEYKKKKEELKYGDDEDLD